MSSRNKQWKHRVCIPSTEGDSSVDLNGVVRRVMKEFGCSDRNKVKVEVFSATRKLNLSTNSYCSTEIQQRHDRDNPPSNQGQDLSSADVSLASNADISGIGGNNRSENSSSLDNCKSNSKGTEPIPTVQPSVAAISADPMAVQHSQCTKSRRREILSVPIVGKNLGIRSTSGNTTNPLAPSMAATSSPTTGCSPANTSTTEPSPLDTFDFQQTRARDVLPLITSPLHMWPPLSCSGKYATDPIVDPFIPFGMSPAQQLTNTISIDKESIRMLLLDCGDCRHLMFTNWCHESTMGLPKCQRFDVLACDRNAAILARDIVLWKMLYDHFVVEDFQMVEDDVLFLQRCWLIFYEKCIDKSSLSLLKSTASSLLLSGQSENIIDGCSSSYKDWNKTEFGSNVCFVNQDSYDRVRKVWEFYCCGIARDSLQEMSMLKHCREGILFINRKCDGKIESSNDISLDNIIDYNLSVDNGMSDIYKAHAILYSLGIKEAYSLLKSSLPVGSCDTTPPPPNIMRGEKLDELLVVNPMMFESADQVDCCPLSYSLDPINCYHSGNLPFFVPFSHNFAEEVLPGFFSMNEMLNGKDEEIPTDDNPYLTATLLARNAYSEFYAWSKAFAARLRQSLLCIKVFVGDELDLCHGLILRKQQSVSAWECVSDSEFHCLDFNGMRFSTSMGLLSIDPTVVGSSFIEFDVIDTGRLADRHGLLHVLLYCQPLLASYRLPQDRNKPDQMGNCLESALFTDFDASYVLSDKLGIDIHAPKMDKAVPKPLKQKAGKRQSSNKKSEPIGETNCEEDEFSIPLPQYLYSILGMDLTVFALATGLIPHDPSFYSVKTEGCSSASTNCVNRTLLHPPSIRIRWHSFHATLRDQNKLLVDDDDLSEIIVEIYEMMFRNTLEPNACPVMMYYQPANEGETCTSSASRVQSSVPQRLKKSGKDTRRDSKTDILTSVESIVASAKAAVRSTAVKEGKGGDSNIVVKQIPIDTIRKNHSILAFALVIRSLFDRLLLSSDDYCTASMKIVKSLQELEMPFQYTVLFELLINFSQQGLLPLMGLRIMSIAEVSLMGGKNKEIAQPFLSSPSKPTYDIPLQPPHSGVDANISATKYAPVDSKYHAYSQEPSPCSVQQRRFSFDVTTTSVSPAATTKTSSYTCSSSAAISKNSAYPTAILLTFLVSKSELDSKLSPCFEIVEGEQGIGGKNPTTTTLPLILQMAIRSCADKVDNCYHNFHMKYLRDKPQGYWNFESLSSQLSGTDSFEDCRWLACSCIVPLPALISRPSHEIDVMLKLSAGNLFTSDTSPSVRRFLLKSLGPDLVLCSAKLADRDLVHWRRLDDIHLRSQQIRKDGGNSISPNSSPDRRGDEANREIEGDDPDDQDIEDKVYEDRLGDRLVRAMVNCSTNAKPLSTSKQSQDGPKGEKDRSNQSKGQKSSPQKSNASSCSKDYQENGRIDMIINGERVASRDPIRLYLSDKKMIPPNKTSNASSPSLQTEEVDLAVRIMFKDDKVLEALLSRPTVKQLARPNDVLVTCIFSLTVLAKSLPSLKRAATNAVASSSRGTVQAVCCHLIISLPVPVQLDKTVVSLAKASQGGPGVELIFTPQTYNFGLAFRQVTADFAAAPNRLSHVFTYEYCEFSESPVKVRADLINIQPVALFGGTNKVFLDILPSIDLSTFTKGKTMDSTTLGWLSTLASSAVDQYQDNVISFTSSKSKQGSSTVADAWRETVRYLVHHLFVPLVSHRDSESTQLRVAVMRAKPSHGSSKGNTPDTDIKCELVIILNRLCLDYTGSQSSGVNVNNVNVVRFDENDGFVLPWTESTILDVCVAVVDSEKDPISAALLLDFLSQHCITDASKPLPTGKSSASNEPNSRGKDIPGIVVATMDVAQELMSFWLRVLPGFVERTRVRWQHDRQSCELMRQEVTSDDSRAPKGLSSMKQPTTKYSDSDDDSDDDESTRTACCVCSKCEQLEHTGLTRFLQEMSTLASPKQAFPPLADSIPKMKGMSQREIERQKQERNTAMRRGFAQMILDEMPELISSQFSRAAIPVSIPIPVTVDGNRGPLLGLGRVTSNL